MIKSQTVVDSDRPTAEERLADERETFLGSSRGFTAFAREFETLVTDVVRRLSAREADGLDVNAVVRRTPARCIIQLGSVALTLSWIRSSAGRVADGRLMVIEWQGAVAQGAEWVPERLQRSQAGKLAVAIREEVLMAEATSIEDWKWVSETTDVGPYASCDLAGRYVESLVSAFSKSRM